jgi:hypothetical protein
MLRTVVKNYTAQYSDPVRGRAGEILVVQHQDDEYPGWWWCRAPDGRQGWVHEDFLQINGSQATLVRDYSARELSAQATEAIHVYEEIAGWAWATNSYGQTGWLPSDCLGP